MCMHAYEEETRAVFVCADVPACLRVLACWRVGVWCVCVCVLCVHTDTKRSLSLTFCNPIFRV